MVNKYIFLDFDGVLNSWRSDIAFFGVRGNPESFIGGLDCTNPRFDPIAVGLVRKLIEETGAYIVISSSWRVLNTLDYLRQAFEHYAWPRELTDRIISVTPKLYRPRGHEILAWCKENCNVEDKFVILDDSKDMLDVQVDNFVHVDPRYGLSYDDFSQALNILR